MINPKKYSFYEYKENYPKLFEKEKKKLTKILPKAEIQHVGSTSILGLGGKGIIDILVVLKKSELKKAQAKLEKCGYVLMPNAMGLDRISMKKDYGFLFWKRRVHVHLTWKNSKTQREMINFKNKLMKEPKLIKYYAKLKKKAAKIAKGDGKVYRKIKNNFIKRHSR